jgi:hypothetical protein
MINTLAVNFLPQPTITIAGNNTTCAGYVLTQNASGGTTYLWGDGTTGATYTTIATINTVVTVTGADINNCTNTASVNITVNPTPSVNVISSQTAICAGQSTTLTATGAAQTYSWNGNAGSTSFNATPPATSVFTLSAENSFGCISSKTVEVIVYPLPTLAVVPSRTFVCKNEKLTLTASGAQSYTWVTQGIISTSVLITPTVAQTYSFDVIMVNSDGCSKTETYQLVVNACTGIGEKPAAAGISIYPNPASGKLQINVNETLRILLTNETGQVVRDLFLSAGGNELDCSEMSPGLYFIQGQKDGNVFREKIVIAR